MRGLAEGLASPDAVRVIDGETVAGFAFESLVEPVEENFGRPLVCPLPDATLAANEDGAPRVAVEINGTWLDDCLRLKGRPGAILLETALLTIGNRHTRKDYRRNFETLVECILANGLRGHIYRETRWISYGRMGDKYAMRDRPWLAGPSLGQAVDVLIEGGILIGNRGRWNAASSTYMLTDEWVELAKRLRITESSIDVRLPSRRSLVILRAAGKSKKERKKEVRFNPTVETEKWRDFIDRYNRFLGTHDIRLDLSQQQERLYVEHVIENLPLWDRQPHIKKPELFKRYVYRIFNDGTFAHGGRLYRGWWMNCPSELRPMITIDGSPTAEADFSGFLPRTLYAKMGIDYKGKPYRLPELESYAIELGHSPDYFDKSVKKVFIALVNADEKKPYPERVKLKIGFGKYKRAEVKGMIAGKHSLLARLFLKAEGKKNHRLDSDIAINILSGLTDLEIPCLSIHDSFVVKKENLDKLIELMAIHYREAVGIDPLIEIVEER